MKSQELEHPLIAITGPMGVGKTTVARLVAAEFGFCLLEEHPEKNPFVANATHDPERWAFDSEVSFLILKLQQNKEAQKIRLTQGVIQDTPIEQDVFSYGRAKLHGGEWKLFYELYKALKPQFMKPSLIVCLEAHTLEVIRRIRERDRNYEGEIQPEYIEQLSRLNLAWVRKSGIPTEYIPTDHLNIVGDPAAQQRMMDKIRKRL